MEDPRNRGMKFMSSDGRRYDIKRKWGQGRRCYTASSVSRRSWCFSSVLLTVGCLTVSQLSLTCTALLIPVNPVMQRPYACGTHRDEILSRQRYFCDCYLWPSSTSSLSLSATSSDNGEVPSDSVKNIPWELFKKHHARFDDKSQGDGQVRTSWVGRWTTYDYVGDILLETMPASVNYIYTSSPSDEAKVQVTHTISTGSVSSDCSTCFDDANTSRTIPITLYTPESIGSKTRLGACSMVVGPSILQKSGTIALEIVLAHTSARVRIMFQHAPVWARGTEPGSCPPQGLKLVRCLVARETLLVPSASPPIMPGTGTHPVFDRSVPPFDWHKKWSGTSWTWGPEAGDRGWSIRELEIGVDDWHGSAPVEAWNLRLPGGIFVQLPRVITSDAIERCRLAWMPDSDTLLRVEAGVLALKPVLEDIDSDCAIVGFEPPALASFRCDVLQKIGDLEGLPSFVTSEVEKHSSMNEKIDFAKPFESNIKKASESRSNETTNGDESAIRTIDDALQL